MRASLLTAVVASLLCGAMGALGQGSARQISSLQQLLILDPVANPSLLTQGRATYIVGNTNGEFPQIAWWDNTNALGTNTTRIFAPVSWDGTNVGRWLLETAAGGLAINGTNVTSVTNSSDLVWIIVGDLATAILTQTGVGAGSYTNPVVTVDADGRVTAIANGTSGLTLEDINNALIMSGGIDKAYVADTSITLFVPLISVNGADSFVGTDSINIMDTATVTVSRSGNNLMFTATAAGGTNASRVFFESAPVDSPNFIADGGDVENQVAGANITLFVKTNTITSAKIVDGTIIGDDINANLNLSAKTSLTIPTSTSPMATTTGKLALWEDVWETSVGGLAYHDGGSTNVVISVPYQLISAATDNQVVKFDNDTGRFYFDDDAGAGGGSTEQLFVNDIEKVSPWKFTNTASVTISTNAAGDIEFTATGGSGTTEQVWINDTELLDPWTFTNTALFQFATNANGHITGVLADGDKGDITVGSGVWKIDAGAVGANELASTAVTPGSYTSANITVDADGRITAASNGSGGGGSGIVVSNLLSAWAYATLWLEHNGSTFDVQKITRSNRIDNFNATISGNAALVEFDFTESRDTNYIVQVETVYDNSSLSQSTYLTDRDGSGFTVMLQNSAGAVPSDFFLRVTVIDNDAAGTIGTIDTLETDELTISGAVLTPNTTLSPVSGTNYVLDLEVYSNFIQMTDNVLIQHATNGVLGAAAKLMIVNNSGASHTLSIPDYGGGWFGATGADTNIVVDHGASAVLSIEVYSSTGNPNTNIVVRAN